MLSSLQSPDERQGDHQTQCLSGALASPGHLCQHVSWSLTKSEWLRRKLAPPFTDEHRRWRWSRSYSAALTYKFALSKCHSFANHPSTNASVVTNRKNLLWGWEVVFSFCISLKDLVPSRLIGIFLCSFKIILWGKLPVPSVVGWPYQSNCDAPALLTGSATRFFYLHHR